MPRNNSIKKRVWSIIKNNLFVILASIFLLGSWIFQNFKESEWSSEKVRMFNWLNIQEISWSDVGQWHIAILQYQSHYEEMKGFDSLPNLLHDRRYAGLCRNWLQLYYGFLNMHYEISETDIGQRLKIQKKLLDTLHSLSFELNSFTIPIVVQLFNKKVWESVSEVRMSGQLIRNKIAYVEAKEKKWNKRFLIFYLFGTFFLAVNFTIKAFILKEKK